MRISPMAQVLSGVLCSSLILVAGCGNPSPQTLASLTVTATPSTLSVGGAAVLKAVAHLTDGTTEDVTAGTQWTLSNPALAKMSNGAMTATAPGTVTVQAAYVETTPAGNSPASTDTSPETLSASHMSPLPRRHRRTLLPSPGMHLRRLHTAQPWVAHN